MKIIVDSLQARGYIQSGLNVMDETLAVAVEKIRAHASQPGVNVEQIAVQIGVATATVYRLLRGSGLALRYSTARAVIDYAAALPDNGLHGGKATTAAQR